MREKSPVNSPLSLSDTRDDKEDAQQHYNSHDHPKYHQPHLHWLLHRRSQCCCNALKLQRLVIQMESTIDSAST